MTKYNGGVDLAVRESEWLPCDIYGLQSTHLLSYGDETITYHYELIYPSNLPIHKQLINIQIIQQTKNHLQ